MKIYIKYLLFTILLIIPFNVFAEGNISVSPTSLTLEVGETKTFTISAYNTIGDVSIYSNNSSVASVGSSSWGTGMVDEKQTTTGTITVTGNSVGSATISLNIDAATFDDEDLSGQVRTVTVNVVAKPTPQLDPTPTPIPPSNNNSNNNNNSDSNSNSDAVPTGDSDSTGFIIIMAVLSSAATFALRKKKSED